MSKILNQNNQLQFAGYKRINYRILNGSEVPSFSATQVSYAIAQALGIWSAWVPIVFKRNYVETAGDIAIGFHPDERGGEIATALIEIDTAEPFFLDKYKEPISLPYGPFDLVAAIAHEIGHRLCYENGHSPVGGLMYFQHSPRVVRRTLNQVEIDVVQNRYGRLLMEDLIFMNLNQAMQLSATGNVNFEKSASKITVQGEEKTSSTIQLSIAGISGKKINAIKIKVKLYSKYAIVNKAVLYDGASALANQILSLSSDESDPTELEVVIGLPKKPVLTEGIKIRIECLFINATNVVVGMDRNRIDISEIKIETLRRDMEEARMLMR